MALYKGGTFMLYEIIYMRIQMKNKKDKHLYHGVSAGIASLFCQLITYPIDIIKKRLIDPKNTNL